ncbi:MAG: hypothetical protein LLF80_07200 [Porphyromonadaceae bacterium]|nr:hypothetical protein [Porphyromonadaceae bacterium]
MRTKYKNHLLKKIRRQLARLHTSYCLFFR